MAHIKTYARLKPSKRAYFGYEIIENILRVHIPDNKDFFIMDPLQAIRSGVSYEILFTEIFKPEATQENVFDVAAKDIIHGFLNGYNGTIFAYGQTGTGKTYTVEGNTSHYSTRGLSTRALSMIYQQLENHVDDHISVYLSYLEIYQEVAYDLLNPTSRTTFPTIPFAKVTVYEGPRDSCILRGLSLHLAASEEVAQMLLFQGQANRKVAETPVNQRSSRSHAVFTVYLQVHKRDSKVVVNSKLHLVDLAGSERVSKTGVDGLQLTEAKSINLSLHHLETVIIALQSDHGFSTCGNVEDRSRGENPLSQSGSNISLVSGPSSDSGNRPNKFVPYRNSLLTMILKDSLGGNCLTAMIATISMEPENVGESISTCRFAQRVARISNNARRNEVVDDKTLIRRLKNKIAVLKREVAILRSQGVNDPPANCDKVAAFLSEKDKLGCIQLIEGFLQGVIVDPVRSGIYDHFHFLECLHQLKQQCLQSVANQATITDNPQSNGSHPSGNDRTVSETFQPSTSANVSQQKTPEISTSEISIDASEEFFSASDDSPMKLMNKSESLEKKCNEICQVLNEYGDKCESHTERVKDKTSKGPLSKRESSVRQELVKPDILCMQRLQKTENSFRMKLKALEGQVADQRAYLKWLKQNRANSIQISKEHLVEQHQLMCQARFRDKLHKILDKKAKLMRSLSHEKDRNHFIRHCCCHKMSLKELCTQMHHNKEPSSPKKTNDTSEIQNKEQKAVSPKTGKEKFAIKTKMIFIDKGGTLKRLEELKQKPRSSKKKHVLKQGIKSTKICKNATENAQTSRSIHDVEGKLSACIQCHHGPLTGSVSKFPIQHQVIQKNSALKLL